MRRHAEMERMEWSRRSAVWTACVHNPTVQQMEVLHYLPPTRVFPSSMKAKGSTGENQGWRIAGNWEVTADGNTPFLDLFVSLSSLFIRAIAVSTSIPRLWVCARMAWGDKKETQFCNGYKYFHVSWCMPVFLYKHSLGFSFASANYMETPPQEGCA